MMRRLKRLAQLELELRILDDAFIRPPRESQRNWLVNRALNEFVDELHHLDVAARRMVAGRDHAPLADRAQAPLRDDEIMEDWQIPVMQRMAGMVAEAGGDVLEIGFGRGVSAAFIQDAGVRSHTIVECNDDVVQRYHAWRAGYDGRDIRLVHGRWEETIDGLGEFDGIFFHTYPLSEDEYVERVVRSVTFAQHFFPAAAAHLRPGGVFTYMTNEADSLSRAHQRLVFQHFRSFTLAPVGPLALPPDSRDDLWSDSMVVIRAVR
jgi:guanidinoacetate N-methyltransferase